MRTLKLLTLLAFMGTVAFGVMAHDIAKKTIFADAKNIVHTTAVISENRLTDDADTAKTQFASGNVELIAEGNSKLDFTDENGKEQSVFFSFGFRRMPDNGVVNIMYDAKKIKHISVEGFDYVDYVSSGLAILAAMGSALLGVLFMVILVIKHLINERSFYKREKRVYGRDISGVKYIFICEIVSVLFFAAGAVLLAVSFYNVGKLAAHVPLAHASECENADADANAAYYDEASGCTVYTFQAENGSSYICKALPEHTRFAQNGKMPIRYLKNDPSQNSVDNMLAYLPESAPWASRMFAGIVCILVCFAVLVFASLLEWGFKRHLRKVGYVDRFKSKDSNILMESEDYSDLVK